MKISHVHCLKEIREILKSKGRGLTKIRKQAQGEFWIYLLLFMLYSQPQPRDNEVHVPEKQDQKWAEPNDLLSGQLSRIPRDFLGRITS